ncbi:MAG: cytochrome c oxidase subunit II [Terrimicrobiaceae bacterium]|nr:cytochrome c oxidase subunit II [Terrimicrobiaceae bacterium]
MTLLLPALTARAAEPTVYPISNMFDPLSKPALMIHESSIVVSLICLVIFLLVTGMIAYVVVKFPSKGASDDRQEPPQIYGSSQIELAWTVIPILITVVLILVTTRTIGEIQDKKMPENAVRVTIIGHQWWWEIHYMKPDGKGGWITDFVTANELHIPLSPKDKPRPTALTLESADVIHSYWVPQLNGKTDVIPNHQNHMWFEPWATGTFLGNCAEYCGTQHANMLIRVMVQKPDEFEKWLADQRAAPRTPLDAIALQGRQVFFGNSCVSCHKIAGTVAVGLFGPDLTHLMARTAIGSGVAPIGQASLRDWVRNPAHLKPGVLMPDMQLSEAQVDQVVAYLMTLK